MAVPYTFATATTAIPLSQLDSNFSTPITIGSTAVPLGNTVTTIVGLANVSSTVLTTPTLNSGSAASMAIQTNGTTAISIDTSQIVSFANNPTYSGGTANGVAYLNGSKVLTTGSALTWDATTLTFGSTGQRIRGDMSNSTIANRLAFQTTTTNGPTVLTVIPNGTSTSAFVSLEGDAAVTNGATFQIQLNGVSSEARLQSGIRGTGTYLPITFYTGGSEQMRLDTAGNLGIGTSSPSSPLSFASATGQKIRFYNALSGYGIGVESSEFRFVTDNGAVFTWGTGTYASPTEWMRLSSGNLGLGVTPSAWKSNYKVLEVGRAGNAFWGQTDASGVFVSSNAYLNGAAQFIYSNSTLATYYTQNAGQHQWFNAPSGTAGNTITFTQAMTLNASGQLGIGTTNPVYKLVVSNAGAQGLEVDPVAGTNSGINVLAYNRSAAAYVSQTNYALDHRWYVNTGSAETMRLDSSGNLLVGATSLAFSEKFQMYGNYAVFNDASYTGFIGRGTALGTSTASDFAIRSSNALAFLTGGATERARIDSSGNMGIGTTSPLAKLDVAGNISPTAAPSSSWGLDFAPSTSSGSYTTIANNATYDLATGSGTLTIYDEGGNGVALIMLYYGLVSIIFQSGTLYSTAQGTANKVNVYYNGGTGKYRIENKFGSTLNLWLSTVRNRVYS